MLLSAVLVLGLIAALAAEVGFRIEKTTISRDDSVYECFPSLTRLANGRILLVYRESDGHRAKTFCRVILRTSDDDGMTFSDRRVLVETAYDGEKILQYNCPKVQQLKDGRVLVLCDRYPIPPGEIDRSWDYSPILFWFSSDSGETWSEPVESGVYGGMPDEVVELSDGTWLLATQFVNSETDCLMQCVSRTADNWRTWSKPIIVAHRKGYDFCEASIIQVPTGEVVCYMRENTNKGRPIYKCISKDGGITWAGPFKTQMDSGHRPVAHLTRSGKVLTTYRYQIGGGSPWAKNTFAYLETIESASQRNRDKQNGIVLPLDHDRSAKSDSGYMGWVETAPGEFFAVNYINDDAPKAQIRGYRFAEQDF